MPLDFLHRSTLRDVDLEVKINIVLFTVVNDGTYFSGASTNNASTNLPPSPQEATRSVRASPRLHEGERKRAPGGGR